MRKMLIMPDTVMLARELQASYERAISPAVQQAPHNGVVSSQHCTVRLYQVRSSKQEKMQPTTRITGDDLPPAGESTTP